MLQFQRMSVVSDLIILKACSHFPGLAISRASSISSVIGQIEYLVVNSMVANGYATYSSEVQRAFRLKCSLNRGRV